ncbi:hypothetical protein EZI54_16565 [Marinobacter halodurans]|uniref:Flp pilus-assembly TadG-like N-terminal domain-containing protein n=1 Tax=Marinobacter halodurans TaxID=2528979 RepID=A0ABY1ZH45_9GAMM|nr:hypothetical protein [Marinobacter halodurans]TBW51851.1 hypothetical protein EZI54_16565 [Marinobacter halodurans]
MNPLARRSNPAGQRGALTVATPLIITVVLLFTVMGLDGARLYALKGRMQGQVNAAAIAAADGAQACGGNEVSLATIRNRALVAANAQGFDGELSDLQITPGVLQTQGTSNDELALVPVADLDQSNAVLVAYSREEPISRFLPDLFGHVTLTAQAAARKEVIATLSAGGSTLTVDNGLLGSLLGAVLGQPGYSLDATSLSSLQNTTVQLGDLLQQAGVDSLADLLPLRADTLARAVRDTTGSLTPVGELFDDLLDSNGIETVRVSDILNAASTTRVPRDSSFETYDLLISLVLNIARSQSAGEGQLLSVPLTISDLNIPLIANIKSVDLEVFVDRAPDIGLGPARRDLNGEWMTRFHSADMSLRLVADAEILPMTLLPGVKLTIASLKVPLAIDIGGGEGSLVTARCARATRNDVAFDVDLDRSVATMATGGIGLGSGDVDFAPLAASVGQIEVFGVASSSGVIDLEAALQATVPGVHSTATVATDYPLYCSPESGCTETRYDDGDAALDGLDPNVDITRLELADSIDVSGLLAPLTSLINNLLDDVVGSLLKAIVSPLLQTLGVGLGGMSVTVTNADQGHAVLIEDIKVVN